MSDAVTVAATAKQIMMGHRINPMACFFIKPVFPAKYLQKMQSRFIKIEWLTLSVFLL